MARVRVTNDAIFIYEKTKFVAKFSKQPQSHTYNGKTYDVSGDKLYVSGFRLYQDIFPLKKECERKVRLDTLSCRGADIIVFYGLIVLLVSVSLFGLCEENQQLRKELVIAKGPVGLKGVGPGPVGLHGLTGVPGPQEVPHGGAGPKVHVHGGRLSDSNMLLPGQGIFGRGYTGMQNKAYKVSLETNEYGHCYVVVDNKNNKNRRSIKLSNSSCNILKMQKDGNLVAYNKSPTEGNSVWASNTAGFKTHLKLSDEGQLHLMNQRNEIVQVL